MSFTPKKVKVSGTQKLIFQGFYVDVIHCTSAPLAFIYLQPQKFRGLGTALLAFIHLHHQNIFKLWKQFHSNEEYIDALQKGILLQ